MTEADALGPSTLPGHRPPSNVFYGANRRQCGLGGQASRRVLQLTPSSVNDIRSMDERISGSLVTRRSPALLAAVFSGVALLLAAIGAYGVLGYTVAERRREIGLRIALGARPGQVRRQLLGTTLRMLAAGGAIGLAGSWLAGRAMQTILYQVPAFHPPTLAVAAIVIAGVRSCPAWSARGPRGSRRSKRWRSDSSTDSRLFVCRRRRQRAARAVGAAALQ